jgi:hypothetical protein
MAKTNHWGALTVAAGTLVAVGLVLLIMPVVVEARPAERYCQMLWIGLFGHAATFSSFPSTSSPFLNSAPALTSATR